MHRLARYSRGAMIEWVGLQERYAERLLERDTGGRTHDWAVNILTWARMMRFGLGRYKEPETRYLEILRNLVRQWKSVQQGHVRPPMSTLRELRAEASRRAFRERYPALARFSDEIATLRGEVERHFQIT